jgi:hypothetical protein
VEIAIIVFLIIALGVAAYFMFAEGKTKGKAGEQYTARTLRLSSQYKVINNLLLKAGKWTTEIDHVIVSNFGIFVIESKNLYGKITGSDNDEQWTQIPSRRIKNKFYNPVKQNLGHIRALRNALYDFPNANFISIVVFSPRADLRVKSSSHVLYTHQLNDTIKSYKKIYLLDEQVERIYKRLRALNSDCIRNRRLHIKSMKQYAAKKKHKK